MAKNPEKNKDSARDTTANDPSSWASPKASDGDGFVKLRTDDLYPERIERLGQYLSDTTWNDLSNLDVTGNSFPTNKRNRNSYPVSPPGEVTPGHLDTQDSEAQRHFNNLSSESSFTPDVVQEVKNKTAETLNNANNSSVDPFGEIKNRVLGLTGEHIAAESTIPTSRWAGIGIEKFPMFVDALKAAQGGLDDSAGSRHKHYVHPTANTTLETLSPIFWADYYKRASKVGQKVTKDAMRKIDSAMEFVEDKETQYVEHRQTIELAKTQAQKAFGMLGLEFPKVVAEIEIEEKKLQARIEEFKSDVHKKFDRIKGSITKSLFSGAMSYGNTNYWGAPFTGPFPEVQGQAILDFVAAINPADAILEGWKHIPTLEDPFDHAKLGRLAIHDDPENHDPETSDWGNKFGPQAVPDTGVLDENTGLEIPGSASRYSWIDPNTVGDFPTLRMANTRKAADKKFRTSTTQTPSLMLLPKSLGTIRHNLDQYGLEASTSVPLLFNLSRGNELWKNEAADNEEIDMVFKTSNDNRFSPAQVRQMEDQLEAEYVPFYIQDLRTNEIISFHAFLESLEDSYSAEWSAQKGFGRLEAAQIYGGGSRSIGVSFTLVPTDNEDFDDMWIKINKLTTLVYPQWSEGTLMQAGDEYKFIQPFSQVPTASPLCRLRIGDLFTSNYSKMNMARMMGISNANFKYSNNHRPPNVEQSEKDISIQTTATGAEMAKSRYVNKTFFEWLTSQTIFDQYKKTEGSDGYESSAFFKIVEEYEKDPTGFSCEWVNGITKVIMLPSKHADFTFYVKQSKQEHIGTTNAVPEVTASSEPTLDGLASIFDSEQNPIFRSFESTMGRGIAVAISSLGFDWKLNSIPWNLDPGHRAPRMCTISLGLIPIHDITPGLDHEGFNRAPIYTVGESSTSMGGDPWHNSSDYNELLNDINKGHNNAVHAEGFSGSMAAQAYHVAQVRDAKTDKKTNKTVVANRKDLESDTT